ncbi:3'(2'),5'-bisphosphate nucleotidase 1 isoform X5 [Gorilla gorilla gorilla]|uniref:3'(2'),5'-bisphosphate nucleotidase 1 isoform X5 n=1 Tax=Gorilla gorilla gorilla TaxID=9595 RepID=UPI00029DC990|nr:3'(2'),5'-bisphosphate nucleotidase 1 isoform X4 [Gorilla gorilla gorilla]
MPSISRLIDSAKARYWTQRGTWVYDNALLLLLKCLWSNVVPECTMASSNTVLMRLVASAYSIAQKAGMIVRRVIAEGDLGIVEKTCATDLQTKADRLAQMSICSSLARKFPKLTIIGEELVVWVDPLDGTKEYTEGLLDNVTVLIGIAYEGKAIAGVINQPYYNYEAGPDAVLGRTIWGVLGLGAFGFQLKEVPAGKHIITTTRSHSNKLVTDCVAAMNPDAVLRVGGAGNKIIQLIEGKASAYVFASPGCKKWDTCAPEVILHAVGGKLTDIHGNVLQYHKDVKHMNSAGVLATLRNYDYYASRVPESIKNALVP